MNTVYMVDDFPGVQIRWTGGSTFNVFIAGHYNGSTSPDGWTAVDCFTVYGDDKGNPPDASQAKDIAQKHLDFMLSEPYCETYD